MEFLKRFVSKTVRHFASDSKEVIMKYLSVAEKNDAAKNIAAILSSGNSTRVKLLKYTILSLIISPSSSYITERRLIEL